MDELEAARLRIYALEDGALRAQALAFCLGAGMFDRLEGGPMELADFVREFGLRDRVWPTLVAFLAANGLVARDGEGRLANTEAASAFLVRSAPGYVGGRGLLFAGFHEAAGHLGDALRSGSPWTPSGQHDMFGGFGAEEQEWFAEGMYANAVHGARWLLEEVDFDGFRRLADVGGNTGGYAIPILRKHPGLEGTIVDLPAVQGLAERRIAGEGMEGRLSFRAGSFFDEDGIPGEHDVLLLSSILHDWEEADCRRILANCYAALEPGGTVVVTEPMLAEDLSGPDHPSVSGLTMVVLGGENRRASQIVAMLEAAGFRDAWASEPGPQNSVVTARKRG